MPNSAATNPSRCGAERHHQFALVRTGERIRCGARREQSRVQRGIVRRETIEEDPVQPHQSIARGQVGEAEAEAQGHCVGGRRGIHHGISPSCAAGRAPDPLLGGQRRQRRVMRPLCARHGTADQRNARLGWLQDGGAPIHRVAAAADQTASDQPLHDALYRRRVHRRQPSQVVLRDPPQLHRLQQRGELGRRKLGMRDAGGEQRDMPLMRPAQQEADVIFHREIGEGINRAAHLYANDRDPGAPGQGADHGWLTCSRLPASGTVTRIRRRVSRSRRTASDGRWSA